MILKTKISKQIFKKYFLSRGVAVFKTVFLFYCTPSTLYTVHFVSTSVNKKKSKKITDIQFNEKGMPILKTVFFFFLFYGFP